MCIHTIYEDSVTRVSFRGGGGGGGGGGGSFAPPPLDPKCPPLGFDIDQS